MLHLPAFLLTELDGLVDDVLIVGELSSGQATPISASSKQQR